jgi:hypothetical protein
MLPRRFVNKNTSRKQQPGLFADDPANIEH